MKKLRRSLRTLALPGTLLIPASPAFAQSAPDPGVLLEQQRRAAQTPAPAAAAAPASPAFQGFGEVKGLESGEERVLREVEARYRGQAVSAKQVLDVVGRELERGGITVVLQADPQGRVLAVKPVLATIDVDDRRERPRADLRAVLGHGLAVPAALDRRQLERNAALVSETPGVRAGYEMLPGAEPGQTRLRATIEDGEPFEGFGMLDNSGNRQVGRLQATAGLNLNNRLGLGERLSVTAMEAAHGRFLQFASDVLLHPSGLRGGLNHSRFDYAYSAVSGDSSVPYDGRATTTGLQATLPLERGEWERSNLTFALDSKRNSGRANGQQTSDWAVDTLALGVQGQRALPGTVTVGYALALVHGHATQRDPVASQRDEPWLAQSGSFEKLTFQATLSRALGKGGLSLGLNAAGQFASKNLPASEKFHVGGPSAMRARDPQLIGGDNVLHLEARVDQTVGSGMRVGGFVETVWLKANVHRVTAAAYQANTADEVHLTDAGLRLSWGSGNALVDVSVARPLQGTPRFMNGSPVAAQPAGSSRWVGYLRVSYRF